MLVSSMAFFIGHRLLDRDRDFPGLALAHADATVAIADHRQRRETEDTTALHDFRDAVDGNHLLAKTVVAFLSRCILTLHLGHVILA